MTGPDKDINPYAPPVGETNTAEPVLDSEPLRFAWKPFVATLLGVICYAIFTFVLLVSTPQDFSVGVMFLCNAPVLIAWCFGIWKVFSWKLLIGAIGVGIQIAITTIMLARNIGDFDRVIGINGAIIALMTTLLVFDWASTHRRADAS